MAVLPGRYIIPLTRAVIIGWREIFTFRGNSSTSVLATKIRFNPPSMGFFHVLSFSGPMEFSMIDHPMVCYAKLPGEPVDPYQWMEDHQWARMTPTHLGPSYRGVSMRVEYTGHIPSGYRAGDKFNAVVMLMGMGS